MLGGSLHTVVATVVLGAGTLTAEAGLLERLKWFSWSECGSGMRGQTCVISGFKTYLSRRRGLGVAYLSTVARFPVAFVPGTGKMIRTEEGMAAAGEPM